MNAEQIFINCPYDSDYRAEYLPAIAFTLMFCAYWPRAAAEVTNGDLRMHTICSMVGECPLSVHDISAGTEKRVRYNMPFELGIVYAARHFSVPVAELQSTVSRHFFVLVNPQIVFDHEFSDMRGLELNVYHSAPAMIEQLRYWLQELQPTPADKRKAQFSMDKDGVLAAYTRFRIDADQICSNRGVAIGDHKFGDLRLMILSWLEANGYSVTE